MLRQFCAVADVPQPEDVGFDAVATLLRRDGGLLYAEESFYVQFKAQSVRDIPYRPHEYKWLRALRMPLFIGSVDLANSRASLFTTHALATRVDGGGFASAVIHLDPDQTRFEDRVLHQSIHPPVLQWTVQQGEDPKFSARAYDVLAKWMELEYANLALRKIRTKRDVRWNTNEVPVSTGMGMMGHPSELDEDLAAAFPYLNKLASHFLEHDYQVTPEVIGFYWLALWLQEKGIPEASSLVKMMEFKIGQQPGEIALHVKIEKP